MSPDSANRPRNMCTVSSGSGTKARAKKPLCRKDTSRHTPRSGRRRALRVITFRLTIRERWGHAGAEASMTPQRPLVWAQSRREPLPPGDRSILSPASVPRSGRSRPSGASAPWCKTGGKPELLPPAVDSVMLGRCFRYHIFPGMASDKARELAGPALLAAFFAAAALLVPPRGEFPINEDWDYFATVADLLHFGEIRLSDWPGMTLVAQIFWGELFAKLFGLSYWTLRVSTISVTFVGALALYFWARAVDRTRGEASFLGLLYATNPLVFTLSYSFMNDVPGTSMMLVCLLVQAHCAQRGRVRLHLLAGVTAALAYLVRQTAALPALVLAAFFVPALIKKQARARDFLMLTLPVAVVAAAYTFWLDHIHGRPYHATLVRADVFGLASRLPWLLENSLLLGVCLAPLTLCLVGRGIVAQVWRSNLVRLVLVTFLVGVSLLVVVQVVGRVPVLGRPVSQLLPPFFSQHVYDFHLGYETLATKTLRGPLLHVDSRSASVLGVIMTLIGVASLVLTTGLLSVGLRSPGRWRHDPGRPYPLSPEGQSGVCCVALIGLVLLQRYPYDRYLIPVFPLLAMFLLSLMPRGQWLPRSLLAWGSLAVFAVASVAGEQDYLARVQARWQAVDYLLQSGVKPEEIRAGFEYAGLYCFSPRYRGPVRPRLGGSEEEVEFCFEHRPFTQYEVRYDPAPGAELVGVFPYRSWFRSGSVLIFRWPVEISAF